MPKPKRKDYASRKSYKEARNAFLRGSTKKAYKRR